MFGLRVEPRNAEKAKRYLRATALLSQSSNLIRSNSFIYFPIASAESLTLQQKSALKKLGSIVQMEAPKQRAKPDYRELLKKELGKKYETATRGFDILGDIAIIDAESSTAKKVAHAVMESNKSVKTVLRKVGAVKGKYRKQEYAYVSGKKNFVPEYRENGIVLKFDLRKTFFSPRLSFERGRIASLSKAKENVVVMFAGVGPFAIGIAKHNSKANVVGIELNKSAFSSMASNIKLNKLANATAVLGDVKKVAAKYAKFADRIIMPLPKDSSKFIPDVIKIAKNRCTVHYYAFVPVDGGKEDTVKQLSKIFKSKGWSFKELNIRVVRPYSHDTQEIVVDFEIRRTK